MVSMRPAFLRCGFFGASMLAAVGAGARAQQAEVQRPVVRAPRGGLIEVEEMVDGLALPRGGGVAVFNAPAYIKGDPEAARRRLELRLKSRIEQIDRACKLTREQREKLNAAGRGDIKRAFARAEELKGKHVRLVLPAENQPQLIDDVAEHHRATTEVDCFGEGSLFSKILPKTLTPEQTAIREKSMREAASAQHLSTIRWAAGSLALWLQLAPEQRQKLESVLIARTRVPRRFGEYDYYGLLFQMSKLPEEELKTIFNVEQRQKMEHQFAEAKRLESVLRLGGFLPEEDLARAGKTRGNNPIAEPEQPRIQAPDF
jgi:hypothetical protein